MSKAANFIDDGYLQNVLKNLSRPKAVKTNYSKLVRLMQGDDQLLRTYYYNCKCLIGDNPTDEELFHKEKQDRFFYSLQKLDQFECKFGRLERRFDENGTPLKPVQKQVDVLMAVDIVKLSLKHLITKAKIISGDADLVPAIKIAKDEGVIVELFYAYDTVSRELLQTVDIATEINSEWIEQIKLAE